MSNRKRGWAESVIPKRARDARRQRQRARRDANRKRRMSSLAMIVMRGVLPYIAVALYLTSHPDGALIAWTVTALLWMQRGISLERQLERRDNAERRELEALRRRLGRR